jgi:BirA family biotin operon repressor/biotin-[acetyl-CoA-carboxylase] ligase
VSGRAPSAGATVALEHWHDEVGSTNDLARAAALAGAPSGSWYLARRQTAGRGRQGRVWCSPEGNFHGSLVLRPTRPPAQLPSLSLVAGLAVAEAVRDLTRGRVTPRLKWPNDVLVGDAKLAGVLLESGDGPDGGAWVVVGVGVNLARAPALPGRATISLAGLGHGDVTPDALLAALRPPLADLLTRWACDGFAALRDTWLAAARGVGGPVTLQRGAERHVGRLADLDGDGALLLELPDGTRRRFNAGELVS